MTKGKIYLVWCQPYDDCAQDVQIFTIKSEAEEYRDKIWREMVKDGIPAIMEMTEAFIFIEKNSPFDEDELDQQKQKFMQIAQKLIENLCNLQIDKNKKM